MKKKAIITFLLISLLILLFLNNGVCQDSFQWEVTYAITLHEDGAATITVEKVTLLKDENETSCFRSYYIGASFDRQKEFSGNVSALIDEVFNKTGRRCSRSPVEYFAGVSSTESGTYGIVRYQFDWMEFAEKMNETNMVIGDVFVRGFFLLGNGMLKIEYPPNYVVREVFPSPDNVKIKVLIWNTTAIFNENQPKIILERERLTLLDYLRENIFLILSVIVVSSVGMIGFLVYKVKRRGFKKYESAGKLAEEELLHELSDEERVIRLLKAAGGTLTQSRITEKLGCSKAKVSQLLALMETKGILKRKKRGREKVVTLLDEKKLNKEN